jgi:hypothetical protein
VGGIVGAMETKTIPSSRVLAALVAVVTGACLAMALVAGIIHLRIA